MFCSPSKFALALSVVLLALPIIINAQILTSDLAAAGQNGAETVEAEVMANRTYVQEQSELQKAVFRSYDRKIRPVRNQSSPVTIFFHAYLMHFSVDQLQQTVLLNGHIYMSWIDEMAVWDPAQFNNVRTTMTKQWELWHPDLRIANSVSGVNQYFEISKRSHATLTSISPNRTKVEVYPNFNIKVGCHFDYSDYPFDQQQCAARLYVASVMSEVELSVYYNLEPSVMLGWGNQSTKRHISDWELLSVQANLSFYRNRKYSSTRPTSAFEAQSSWSLLLLGVRLRRNAPLFWLSLALPSLCCALVNVVSFLLPVPEHSVGLLLLNFFLHGMFIRDALRALPPAVGDTPRIVLCANILLPVTLLCLLLHLGSRSLCKFLLAQLNASPPSSALATFVRSVIQPQEEEEEIEKSDGGRRISPLVALRLCCALLLLVVSVPLLSPLFRMSA
uniref:Neur_chan_LBD domain-containing protein n=1 Tax=Globodera pallida TaxID=36090 RepID=A0A183BTD5_GLOPA